MSLLARSSLLAVLAAAGCEISTAQVGRLDQVLDMPAIPNRNVDVLFVIDNSPSMLDKQLSLRASFPNMMDALATLDGGLPNLHIGVVTSDMGTSSLLDAPGPGIGSGPGSCSGHGDDGNLQHYDGANVPAPELGGALYISDVDGGNGTRTRNYTGELRDVFSKIASLGSSGCGFEQHLSAMRRGLGNPANGDFVRPDANLAVIILTDEDDCSLSRNTLMGPDTAALGPLQSFRCTRFGITCDQAGETPDAMNQIGSKGQCHQASGSPYVEEVTQSVDYLVGLKGDARAVMVAAIAGPPESVEVELRTPPGGGTAIPTLAHSCMYNGSAGVEVADPGVRISQLVDAFPGRGTFQSVCNNDLSLSLSAVGYSAKKLLGDPCIDTPLSDTSDLPGIQPLCTVDDGTDPTPPCDGTNLDHCWQVVADAGTCSQSPDHLKFVILRSAPPIANTYVSVRCLRAP